MSATITVATPAYGSIVIESQNPSAYQVHWYPTNPANDRFVRWRVVCEACGQTMYTSTANPAAFNISALEAQGHPGPFVISAETKSAGSVEVLASLGTGSESAGTVTPPWQEVQGTIGQTVTFTVTCTPANGYTFLGWSRNPTYDPSEIISTSRSATISRTITAYDDVWDYYAHLEQTAYAYNLATDYHVSADPVTHRTASGCRSASVSMTDRQRLRLYYYGTLYERDGTTVAYSGSNDFGYVDGVPKEYLPGQSITATLTVTDSTLWNLLGLRVLGWRITTPFSPLSPDFETFVLPDNSGSVTFTTTSTPPQGTYRYIVEVILGTSDVHKLTFACKPDDGADLYVYGKSYSAGNPTTRGIGTRVTFAAAGDVMALEVMSILLPESGFIHGWSANLPDSTQYAGSPVASKDLTMPNSDTTVTVYFCNHRLVYGSSGSLLYGRQNSLLYNCSVPPGTTVYD